MKLFATAFAATLSFAAHGAPVLQAPYASSVTQTSHNVSGSTQSFGHYGLNGLSAGPAAAQAAVGADAGGLPFVSASSSSVNVGSATASASAWSRYSWAIVGDAASGEFVPVTITTSGHILTSYGFDAYQSQYNLLANSVRAAAVSSFDTATDHGRDQRTYGLQTPGFNFGGTTIFQPEIAQGNSGRAVIDESFEFSFTLMVQANVENFITMQAASDLYLNSTTTSRYGQEWYSSVAYVDPLIRIDPAYSTRFSLLQSAVPTLILGNAVPEPSSLALGLGALACLVLARRPRRATA